MLMSIYLGDFKYFNRYYCGKGIRMVAKAHKKYVFTILVTRDEVQLNMNKNCNGGHSIIIIQYGRVGSINVTHA